ncbi:MAG: alpha/beta fold hydrolase [Ignavibacteriaceae bacterium]|jgi:carboxylesterase
MKNSEANIKKEIVALRILGVFSLFPLVFSIWKDEYLFSFLLVLMLFIIAGHIKGKKNLQVNLVHFKKFRFDEISGEFEVAKPVGSFGGDKKHGVLLLHGFSASPQEYRFIIPLLIQKNIPFYAPRLTGFGIANVVTLQSVKAVQWLRDSLDAYDLLKQQVDEISIVGHSMGGLLAALVSQQREVKELVLSAPYLVENENHSFRKKLLKTPGILLLMSLFLPVVKKSSIEQNSDRFVYHAVPLHSIKALWDLHGLLVYEKIKKEIFLLSGSLDNTTNNRMNTKILSAKNIAFKKYEFEKSGHNIFEDVEREEVAQKVIEILTE